MGQQPEVNREQALFYADQSVASLGVIAAVQHKAIIQRAPKIHQIERFTNALRQRVSRLVRRTVAFSQKMENPIGAIRSFLSPSHLPRAALRVEHYRKYS